MLKAEVKRLKDTVVQLQVQLADERMWALAPGFGHSGRRGFPALPTPGAVAFAGSQASQASQAQGLLQPEQPLAHPRFHVRINDQGQAQLRRDHTEPVVIDETDDEEEEI